MKAIKIPDTNYTVEFHIIEIGGSPIYKEIARQMVFFPCES